MLPVAPAVGVCEDIALPLVGGGWSGTNGYLPSHRLAKGSINIVEHLTQENDVQCQTQLFRDIYYYHGSTW